MNFRLFQADFLYFDNDITSFEGSFDDGTMQLLMQYARLETSPTCSYFAVSLLYLQ